MIYNNLEDFKEAIRSAYDWDEIFSYLGISPISEKLSGYTYYSGSSVGCHDEKTPSVQKFDKSLHCYGCGESFDFFKVIDMNTGEAFMDTLTQLGERKGITYEPVYSKQKNDKPKDTLTYKSGQVQMVMAVFMKITNHLLFNSAAGEPFRTYLESRNLDLEYAKNLSFELKNKRQVEGVGCIPLGKSSTQEIKKFMLGLIQANVKDSGITTIADLDKYLKIAKLINSKGNFKLMGRVIFVITSGGYIVNMYGRKITSDDQDTFPKHLYLELENHGFYNFDNARKQSYAMLSECIIDAVSAMQYGINTISTFGVGGWKSEICLKALSNSKIKLLYICYDKDMVRKIESLDNYRHHSEIIQKIGPAGMRSAIKVAREVANNTFLEVRIMNLPYDIVDNQNAKNDINNFVKKSKGKSKEEMHTFFHNLMKESRDADTSELLLKMEIMAINKEYYTEQDVTEAILEVVNKMHFLNAFNVIKLLSQRYQLPFHLLFTYQMMLGGQNTKI